MAFELTPKAGGWTEKVLHNFSSNGEDGYFPLGGLIFDGSGNLYGITVTGGTGSCISARGVGCGTVFRLKPAASGNWEETVLYSFNNDGADGEYPQAGLILDASGNLYGTTVAGGAEGSGTVFELTPKAGKWKETILYSFSNNGADGVYPNGGLTLGPSGDLYGTTYYGGPSNFGTVFELRPTPGGGWKERVLHSFNGSDGRAPEATLIFDALGNLYGTTELGGGNSYGTVFEMTPAPGGKWEETVLHSFTGSDQDGNSPEAGLVFDVSGNLYGTTVSGGAGGCIEGTGCGTVFELTPTAGGGWTAKVLYSFRDNGKDGTYPQAGLIMDASGSLFGTTSGGGGNFECQDQCGMIFEIRP